MRTAAIVASFVVLSGSVSIAEEPWRKCISIDDSLARLNCYDRVLRNKADVNPLFEKAKTAIIKKLKDPESARFSSLEEKSALDFKNNPVQVVCGQINAKNSSGGYTGNHEFYYIVQGDRAFIFLGSNISQDMIDEFITMESLKRYCGDRG
jgi:hypothetical protein